MKLFLLPVIILAMLSLGFAQQPIYIVGSDGDRNAIQTAIANLLSGGPSWQFRGDSGYAERGITAPGVTKNLNNAQQSNYGVWNGSVNNTPVIVRTSFIGGPGAIAALSANLDVRFVASNGTESQTSIKNPYSSDATQVTDYIVRKADFGFSNNFQATTPYNGVYNGITYGSLIQETVGVSPIVFVASPGFPSNNLTTDLATLISKSGVVSVALFTGNSADYNKLVYALGRNTDSGERYASHAQFRIGALASVTTWLPTVTGGVTLNNIATGGTTNSHILWPEETVSNVFSPTGSGGFSNATYLARFLTVTLGTDAYKAYDPEYGDYTYPNATAGYYLGYLTPSDATSRVTAINADGTTNANAAANIPVANRGVQLKFNGVDFNTTNVQNGTYTAWVYNRILKPVSTLSPALVNTFYNNLRDEIRNTTATQGGGIKDDANFRVKRSADGGNVILK